MDLQISQKSGQISQKTDSRLQDLFNWEIEVLVEEFLATKKSLNTKKSYSKDLMDFFEKYQILKRF